MIPKQDGKKKNKKGSAPPLSTHIPPATSFKRKPRQSRAKNEKKKEKKEKEKAPSNRKSKEHTCRSPPALYALRPFRQQCAQGPVWVDV
jgi:hypothetical protein